jgi:hypothetical protein
MGSHFGSQRKSRKLRRVGAISYGVRESTARARILPSNHLGHEADGFIATLGGSRKKPIALAGIARCASVRQRQNISERFRNGKLALPRPSKESHGVFAREARTFASCRALEAITGSVFRHRGGFGAR